MAKENEEIMEVTEETEETQAVETKPEKTKAAPKEKAALKKDAAPEDLSHLTTAQQLARQPKVHIMIPPRNPKDKIWYGMINDCPLSYPVGKDIEVPVDVAKLIRANVQLEEATDAFAAANVAVAQ